MNVHAHQLLLLSEGGYMAFEPVRIGEYQNRDGSIPDNFSLWLLQSCPKLSRANPCAVLLKS